MKKYYLWVLGCQMNMADSERIAAIFENAGIIRTDKELEADYIVTVACSVRQTAIDRIYGKMKKWDELRKKKGTRLIVTGCILAEDYKKLTPHFDLIFEIQNTSLLENFLGLQKETGSIGSFFSINPKYQSSFRAFVPISFGCNNFCSYCAVPYTRGREISRPQKDIISEVRTLIQNGYREITLLGQNVNSYGNDLGESDGFSELISNIDKIPGEYRIYFYSNHPKDMTKKLITVLASLKHFPHYLHLPLQSGSDKIIEKMNRHYSQNKYLDLVQKIRQAMPDIAITTDIIVGFPIETETDFEATKEVMEKVNFSMAFIAKYSPRSGTVSAKMEDNVTKTEKDNRFRILTNVLGKSLEKENSKLIGKTLRVLVDEQKKEKFFGRSDSYKVVEITGNKQTDLIGRFVNVEIIDSTAWTLEGKLIP